MYKVGHHSLSRLSIWPPFSPPTPRKHISPVITVSQQKTLRSYWSSPSPAPPPPPTSSSHILSPPRNRDLCQTHQVHKPTLSRCASNIPYRTQTAPTSRSSSSNALPRSPHHTRSAPMGLRAPRPISTKVLVDALDARAEGTYVSSLYYIWVTPGAC